jgi:hypothetical protein
MGNQRKFISEADAGDTESNEEQSQSEARGANAFLVNGRGRNS